MITCNICNKYILFDSCHLICSVCEHYSHVRCLPNVEKYDNLYTNRHINNWICMLCAGNIFPFNNIEK